MDKVLSLRAFAFARGAKTPFVIRAPSLRKGVWDNLEHYKLPTNVVET